jgi:hypothetical protein
MTCKPIQNPSGVTLVRIALLRLRDLELTDLEHIAVIPPTLKAFKKSNTVRLLLLLRSQFHDKGIFLKAYTEMAYGQFLIKGWTLRDASLMFSEEMTDNVPYSRLFHTSVLLREGLEEVYVPPATRCTLTVLIHLFHTTLKPQLDEAVIEWLLAK